MPDKVWFDQAGNISETDNSHPERLIVHLEKILIQRDAILMKVDVTQSQKIKKFK